MYQKDIQYRCPQCKLSVDKNMKFCAHCGASLEAVELIPAADSEKQKKPYKIAAVVLIALVAIIGIGYLIIAQSKGVSQSTSQQSLEVSAELKADKEMKTLIAQKVLEPENGNKADFVVGRWLINGENLRIRKIGATEYRADDEVNKKAYAISWDGVAYNLKHGDNMVTFIIKNFDNLMLKDGHSCGYRIGDNGARIVRKVRTELFEDLMTLPFDELKKKYRLESISREEERSANLKNMVYSASLAFGKGDIGYVGPNMVGHFFKVKDTDVFIHYTYPVYDDPMRELTEAEIENAYKNVPKDAYPTIFSGSCQAFITNMPKEMSQKQYMHIIYPKISQYMTGGVTSEGAWIAETNNGVHYPGASFNFDHSLENELRSKDSVGPNSRVCFYTARVSHKDIMTN